MDDTKLAIPIIPRKTLMQAAMVAKMPPAVGKLVSVDRISLISPQPQR